MGSSKKGDMNLEFLLWAQRVKKEQRAHRVCRNFRVHPDGLDCLPEKINLRKPTWSGLSIPADRADPPEGSVAAYLPKLRERGPKERSFLPQTAAQDIGWAVSSNQQVSCDENIWPSAIPPSDAPNMTERRRSQSDPSLLRANSLPPNPPRPKVPPALERTRLSAPGGSLGPVLQRPTVAEEAQRSTWRHPTTQEQGRDFGKELAETRSRLQQRYRVIEKNFVGRNQNTYHGLSTSDVSSYATSFVLAFGMNPFSKNVRS